MLTFGSLFTGIGGFDLGFERAGMECRWQVEVNRDCQRVLGKRFTNVERFEDVTRVADLSRVDVICGGFPCQDLSVAGKRQGLAGARSGLWFEFLRIIREARPQTVIIENVPGLLSGGGGRDFAVILQGLVKSGYGVAWRVFDAQYFGLAQRRKRVFIVGSLGNGSCAEILFESESCGGNTPPSRKARSGIAGASGRNVEGGSVPEVAWALQERDAKGQDSSTKDGHLIIAFTERSRQEGRNLETSENLSSALTNPGSGTGAHCRKIAVSFGVRRLTPIECERLQGFPDNWTAQDVTGKAISDSARYRMLGNAVAVPVAEWIGKQIVKVMS